METYCFYFKTLSSSAIQSIIVCVRPFGNLYVLVVFHLLPNKNTESNRYEFMTIIDYINVNTVFVDFKTTIHNNFQSQLPQVKIRDCRFHLTLSQWRKIQESGLSIKSKNNYFNIGHLLKPFFSCRYTHQKMPNTVFVTN